MSFIRPPRGDEEIYTWRERLTRYFNRSIDIKPTTVDYEIQTPDNMINADATSNTVTVTLPEAGRVKGRTFNVKCINDTNTVSIATRGTEELDGDTADFVIILHETVTMVSDGFNWWII